MYMRDAVEPSQLFYLLYLYLFLAFGDIRL